MSNRLRCIVGVLILVLIVLTILSAVFFKLVRIPSSGMESTYLRGENILFLRIGEVSESNRGEVVLFECVGTMSSTEPLLMVKRLVGLPGDEVHNNGFSITVNGEPVSTLPGSVSPPPPISFGSPFTISDGQYLVVGDNHQYSYDSRHFGYVSEEAITHRVFLPREVAPLRAQQVVPPKSDRAGE